MALVPANSIITDSNSGPSGYFQLTSLASAVSLPGSGHSFLLTPEGEAVRIRDDGVDPTTTVGFLIPVGTVFEYKGDPSKLRVIEVAASATLNVSVYGGKAAKVSQFVTTWVTSNLSAGSSTSTQVKLPLIEDGTYNFKVQWGDGNLNEITAWDQAEVTHTYSSAGTYTITITGQITGWRFDNAGDKLKIVNIRSWGPIILKGTDSQTFAWFYGCANMEVSAGDRFDFTMFKRDGFRDCAKFNGKLNNWDFGISGGYTDCFRGCSRFNQPIVGMGINPDSNHPRMLRDCVSFNQPVGDVFLSAQQSIAGLFHGCTVFNQPVEDWGTLGWHFQTFDLNSTFEGCLAFDQDLSSWDFTARLFMTNFLKGATLSTANYNALLVQMEATNASNNVPFHGGFSKHSGAGTTARTALINDHSWIITDGGAA